MKALEKASVVVRPGEAPPSAPDFPAAFRVVAQRFKITAEQAEDVVRKWVAEKPGSADLSERAQAEFLARNFTKSAELSDTAAEDKLRRARQLAVDHSTLVIEAVEDLIRAGVALYASRQFCDALARFESALTNVSKSEFPSIWAWLQNWLGVCHYELGTRMEGAESATHIRLSVSA